MKAASGSKGWFADIFNRHYEYIRNYLFYLSGDIKLAEDLVQDVFLQLWETRNNVKDETVGSYLFTIARNCFLKSRRKQKYDLKFRSTYFEHFEHESPEFLLEMKDFDEKLQSSIAGLPEKCRIIFLMHRIDGISYREIAENLGVSIKAVEKQMSKALALLRKKLGDKI
jgi:RNA polymerase sigma-70 factor (family 1)